ncbi:MAG TPA: hypothetical protein VKY19_15695 [Ktedonosporobacter sp.]|jgi:hypothetical protein|nr:hypothetical protein [Ktedonosporobacter sp.]
MHQVASRPQPNQQSAGGGATPQAILVIAIMMFALSGLLIGFAVGAFVRPASPRANLPKQSGATLPAHSPTATQPPAIQPVPLGCPEIENTSSAYTLAAQLANGTTTYTLSAQAKDKSVGTCSPNNKPVASPGILCKLWLTTRIPDKQILLFPKEDARLKRGDLTAPLTGTIQNTDYAEVPGLQFTDPTMPQSQQCDAQGHGSWKYTIAPTVPPGDYDLVVMTDWSTGRYFNWTWVNVTIK